MSEVADTTPLSDDGQRATRTVHPNAADAYSRNAPTWAVGFESQ
jgi:hypothetical protein